MIVRIRFGRGPMIARRHGKNSRMARLFSSLFSLASLSCASFGIWRMANDLGWAGEFVFTDGLLSHWQVWIGVAAGFQYGAWRLSRYSKIAISEMLIAPAQEQTAHAEKTAPDKLMANI